ncbi:hypothetical protein [Ursidibacter arcticus]
MRTQFKTSLISLILFSLTACGGSKSTEKPRNIQTEKQNPVVETNKSQSPTPSTASTGNNNQVKPTSPNTKPSSTRNVETDSEGIEWRNRTLTPHTWSSFKTLKVASEFVNDNEIGYAVQGGNWGIAPLSEDNSHIVIDFKKLAEKDGKIYFGVHEGKLSDPTMQGYNDHTGSKVRRNDVDYLFANQPNTTYGILHDGNTASLFYQGLYAGKPFPENVIEFIVQDERNNYRTELKGSATYRGQVLATTVLAKGDREYGYAIPSKPFVDGTVTLTADFGGSKKFLGTDSSVKGEIDSKTLGKIQLNEAPVYKIANAFDGKAFSSELSGEYSGLFTGPKLDDAVGRIKLEKDDAKAGELKEYHAVFGGVKQ